MLGILPLKEGIEKAEELGLDLVEVSPNAKPPVCKIIEYGKFKYAAQKKAAEARKKQKTVEIIPSEFNVQNWSDIDYGSGNLIYYEYPKKYAKK